MNPKITVLMPAYNAGKYIGEAIQSVLNQSYSDWELLIVNDGSTDDTVEIVESYDDSRIRLLNNPENLRLIKTLNRGLEEARGELIARLDADDLATPLRLELQVAALEAHPELVMVGGRSNVIDSTGACLHRGEDRFLPSSPGAIRLASMFFNPFRHSAVTFRRATILELGGYPATMQNVEDFALWSRLIDKYDTVNLDDVVCDYRQHGESVMSQAKKQSAVNLDEPRLAITQPVYTANALRESKDPRVAEFWGTEWPKVQYAYGRPGQLKELYFCFGDLIRKKQTEDSYSEELKRIFTYGLRSFSIYSWRHGYYLIAIRLRLKLWLLKTSKK
jgi:glycosyltransferase involved in cell wall biosynthesis